MGIYSCKGCDSRFPGCHSTCPTYRAEKAVHDAQMAEYRKKQNAAAGLNAQKYGAITRAAKRLATTKTKGSANG